MKNIFGLLGKLNSLILGIIQTMVVFHSVNDPINFRGGFLGTGFGKDRNKGFLVGG